jgi:hypothetical protein
MEEFYGAGKEDSKAMRGHIPIKPTDIVANIDKRCGMKFVTALIIWKILLLVSML